MFGFGKKKKKQSDLSVEEYMKLVNPRIIEKMNQSDLLEFLDKQRVSGKDVDIFYGQRLSMENPFIYFVMQLISLNSGIVSKESFEKWDCSEDEVNAIFPENVAIRNGLSHPSRCVKDLIWTYMFNEESAKINIRNGNDKLAESIVKTIEIRRNSTEWLDWDRVIDEFWNDEDEKDYRSYIITD